MVALDEFRPKSVGAISSITMEVVTAIFALASLSSLLIALRVSVVCTSLSASELWQFMLPVSAPPAILIGLIIAARMRQTEPLRVDRRLFRLSHAAMAGSFSMA